MVLKTRGMYIIYLACLFCPFILTFVKSDALISNILFALFYFTTGIWVSIAWDKTLVFSKDGICVKWLWFSKNIRYNELNLKRIEHFSGAMKHRSYYTCGAVFSKLDLERPKFIVPALFALFHPFSYIFVYFSYGESSRFASSTSEIIRFYEVEKTYFLSNLEKLGVEIDQS